MQEEDMTPVGECPSLPALDASLSVYQCCPPGVFYAGLFSAMVEARVLSKCLRSNGQVAYTVRSKEEQSVERVVAYNDVIKGGLRLDRAYLAQAAAGAKFITTLRDRVRLAPSGFVIELRHDIGTRQLHHLLTEWKRFEQSGCQVQLEVPQPVFYAYSEYMKTLPAWLRVTAPLLAAPGPEPAPVAEPPRKRPKFAPSLPRLEPTPVATAQTSKVTPSICVGIMASPRASPEPIDT